MLNEKDELNQYTGKIKNCSRLNSWFFFKKNRGGIPRALTIIARYYLFDVYEYASLNANQKAETREKVKHILAAWCGFELHKDNEKNVAEKFIDMNIIQNDKLTNWLPLYLLAHPYKDAKKDFMINELASFKEDRSLSWYVREPKDIYQLVNHTFSINSINFYTIIADAINQGPLKVRQLEYDSDAFKKDFKISKKRQDRIDCLIAAYLLNLNDAPANNQPVILNNIDLSNWMNYPSIGRGNHFDTLLQGVDKFISYSNGYYVIQKDFIEKYGFRVTTIES